MLILNIHALKIMAPPELQATIDRAISAVLYPCDDPTYVDGFRLAIDRDGEALAYDVVALRYLWFLYKQATIPGYRSDASPAWYDPDSRGSSAAAGK